MATMSATTSSRWPVFTTSELAIGFSLVSNKASFQMGDNKKDSKTGWLCTYPKQSEWENEAFNLGLEGHHFGLFYTCDLQLWVTQKHLNGSSGFFWAFEHPYGCQPWISIDAQQSLEIQPKSNHLVYGFSFTSIPKAGFETCNLKVRVTWADHKIEPESVTLSDQSGFVGFLSRNHNISQIEVLNLANGWVETAKWSFWTTNQDKFVPLTFEPNKTKNDTKEKDIIDENIIDETKVKTATSSTTSIDCVSVDVKDK